MSVKEGYKQTELGVIPQDWETVDIGRICTVVGGGTPSTNNSDYWNGSINWFTPTEVGKGKYKTESKRKISKLGLLKSSAKMLPPGTILLSSRASIGDLAILTETACTNQGFQSLICNNDTNNEFIYYSMLTKKTDLVKNASGSTFLEITPSKVKTIKLALPQKKEQEKIAKALSDTDAYIDSLEKLIAKKQLIKEGLMANLLTGKERLAEFAYREDGTKKGYKESELGLIPEDWDVKTVFELADYNKNLFNDGDWIEAEYITDKGIRLIQTGNIGVGKYIETKVKKYISEYSFNFLRCKELKEGDLLICRLAEPAGRACIFEALEKSKTITSVDVTIFRPSTEKVNRDFYLYYFSYPKWFDSIQEHVGGTTHKRISRNSLGKISVVYPGLKEQTEIAKIIKTLTSEIDELEKKLKKTQFIKQGMMQKLLTGEIRLINPPTQP